MRIKQNLAKKMLAVCSLPALSFLTRKSLYFYRLYKAGDWGYMLSDGSFEICGRCDSMVKIRGYSVETQVKL